ncbi:MAG: hypothetical protein V4719_01945 [Planctomycetota bacterium]
MLAVFYETQADHQQEQLRMTALRLARVRELVIAAGWYMDPRL